MFDKSTLSSFISQAQPEDLSALASQLFSRVGSLDVDPVAHWGLRGLLNVLGDQFLPDDLVDARTYLRPLVPDELKAWALERRPAPLPTAQMELMAAAASQASK